MNLGLTFHDLFISWRINYGSMQRRIRGGTRSGDFWKAISYLVSPDRWTGNEDYDEAVALFREMREAGLRTMEGKEREGFKKET
ncbi:hypothetical protein BDW68DRAFT_171443 [Aspergillus falconensis]